MTELALIHRDPPIRWPELITTMQDAGYSLRDIAGALAVPHTTVQRWQSGRDDNGNLRPGIPNYEDGRALLALFERVRPTLKTSVRIA